MKLRIEFEREAGYHEKKLTLLLMRFFNPTKLSWLGSGGWSSKGPEVVIEGATPLNPFEVMEQINESMAKEVKDWSHGFTITYIEMESRKEKGKIDSWILIDKLKGNP
jgi:hypothetical protein